ncbi:MAG: hypothetical protein KC550_04185 [Nanoarchaeota archaeon]|nr:hypothetical protein [Nanoarchaeota archaeon]
MEIFDTHKFFYTLNHENKVKGHEVIFVDRNNNEKKIILERVEVGTSPVSCKLFDVEGNRYLVPFIRIRKVFLQGKLVWDNSDADLSGTKIIKGYE